jgi:UDP-N-acetylglucosamine--N-acetylmuramyl-(pentapeptide) pyrophosphoryl-undecaprenol N-acetylglucosamine transferase
VKSGLILLAAGGTGGHMFPAQALSEILLENNWRVKLSTDNRGARFLESFPKEIEINISESGTFSGVSLTRKLLVPWVIIKSSIFTIFILRRDRPDLVVGFGGYPTLPILIASTILKIPLVLQEQNGVLGLVNKLFSKRAKVIACGTWPTLTPKPVNKIFTGNPVRSRIMRRRGAPYIPPGDYPMSVLVIGGSQGANILSKVIPDALSCLPKSILKNIRVSHQARIEDVASVIKSYDDLGIKAVVNTFFNDIDDKYVEAQLVISRSGASSVADISIIGRPSILIPFAGAVADHQTINAKPLEENGGAIVLQEAAVSSKSLAKAIEKILTSPTLAKKMSNNAQKNGIPEATKKIYEVLVSVIEVEKK